MEEEKENRPMSDVLSIKTDSGRPVRNTKRLNYLLVHSGKISVTKRKGAKGPVSRNSSKVPETINENNTEVPDSNNKNSEEVSDTANKTDLQLTRMDQDSNNSLPSGNTNSEESPKTDDKETAQIVVTIQEPKDEVDLYLGNQAVNTEDEGSAKTEDEGNVKTEDEGNVKTEDEGNVKTEDEGNVKTEDEGNSKTEDEGNIKMEDAGNINTEDLITANIYENANFEHELNLNTDKKINTNTQKESNANTEDQGNVTLKQEESNGTESNLVLRQILKDVSTVKIEDSITEESVLKRPVRISKRPNYSLLHKGPDLNLNQQQKDMKIKPTQIEEDDDATFLSEKVVNSISDPTSANSANSIQINPKQNQDTSSSPKQSCSKESDNALAEEEGSSPNKKIKCCSDESIKKDTKVSNKNTKKSRDGVIKKNDVEIDESEEESEQERSEQKDLIVTLKNFFDDNHLKLEPRSPTKADGNCFFRSIVDQLELLQIPHQPTTHKKLRLEISNFLSYLPDNVMQTTVDVVFKGKKSGLKNLAYRQKKPGQFVDNNGIMVMATGLFLKRQIHVHSKTPNDCHCVTKIEGGEGSENLDPLTIFYFQDHQHYQSICKTV